MLGFPAAELQDEPDFVSFLEEAASASEFDLNVMFLDAGAKFQFLGQNDFLIFAGSRFFFLDFVAVLADIADFANRRLRIGGNFDEVETKVACLLYCFLGGQDPEHFAVGVDNTYFICSDLIVDARAVIGARRLVTESRDGAFSFNC